MIYDIHTHHFATSGEAIEQLTPDAFHPKPGCYYSVGLHPWDISDRWPTQMAGLLVKALHSHVLMIGECGLDKRNGTAPLELQVKVFREHIRLSELIRKPLIVHCVKAFDELLAIRKESKATQPWIIHGFRGGIEQWRQLTHAGLHISIGRYHNAELLKSLAPHHLLIESDEYDNLSDIYNLVSESTGISVDDLKRHVATNIHHLFTAQR